MVAQIEANPVELYDVFEPTFCAPALNWRMGSESWSLVNGMRAKLGQVVPVNQPIPMLPVNPRAKWPVFQNSLVSWPISGKRVERDREFRA